MTPKKSGERSSHKHSFGRGIRRAPSTRKRLAHISSAVGIKITPPLPPLKDGDIRIIPLGGVEEIGRNMTVIEIDGDIVVVDCGFQFSEEETPGIDYILPNTKYLEDRRDKIRGMIITHGHLDHIGAVPYVIDRIGNPPIYTRKLTGVMIKKRQEEFSQLHETDIREIEQEQSIRLGNLTVRFFAVTHTIPDSMGIIIETPYGDIVVTGDIKLNHVDGVPTKEEEDAFSVFKGRHVLALLMDSTNVWQAGWSTPESKVFETLEEIIEGATGRMIIGTFASQLARLMHIVMIAEKYDKRIVIEGRSMKTNIEMVRELGILKHKDETVISSDNMEEYPPEKIIILATGAQGDEYAALMRIANKSHRTVRLTPKDTVVLSSSVIPGNERAVQKLKDRLARQGAHIITYQTGEFYVHATGHGNREEAKWIHGKIRPKFFIPQHGHHYMLRVHSDLIQESVGMPEKNIIIPDNGSIIEIREKGSRIVKLKETAPREMRVVEGQSISELSDVLMRDRKALGQEGFCVVVATINKRTGNLHKSPDIISRGFVYLRENKELMDQTRLIVRKTVEQTLKRPRGGDLEDARADLAEAVTHFLLQKTQKRPIVIPVIVSV